MCVVKLEQELGGRLSKSPGAEDDGDNNSLTDEVGFCRTGGAVWSARSRTSGVAVETEQKRTAVNVMRAEGVRNSMQRVRGEKLGSKPCFLTCAAG
jgi:hypothetical protein